MGKRENEASVGSSKSSDEVMCRYLHGENMREVCCVWRRRWATYGGWGMVVGVGG